MKEHVVESWGFSLSTVLVFFVCIWALCNMWQSYGSPGGAWHFRTGYLKLQLTKRSMCWGLTAKSAHLEQ